MTTNLSRDEQLRGRQLVRNALRHFTSDMLVFYNPKINMAEMNDLYDRPLDVIIMHRTRGLIAIAIKSGEIVEESGSFVSQYQPTKQYYKIIDPINQAKKAMLSFLNDFDPAAKDYIPINVAVFFPDTQRTEFANPNPVFLFKEHLDMPNLQSHVATLLHDQWDSDRAAKYASQLSRLKDFLKSRSDNNIERVERKEALSKLGVREEKKAYQLPGKANPGQAQKSSSKTQPRSSQQGKPPAKRLPGQVAPPLPSSRSRGLKVEEDDGLLARMQALDSRFRETRAGLTGGQWGLLIAIAAIIICVAYFVGRNSGVLLRLL